MAITTEAPEIAMDEIRSFAPQEAAPADGPHRLLPGERPHGAVVFDRAGEKVGVIDDLAIDEATGKVAYAILHHGGFLGLGRRCRPVPWSLLAYDARTGGYVTPLDRAAIEGGPSFQAELLAAPDDGAYRQAIHDYYDRHGASPYWL